MSNEKNCDDSAKGIKRVLCWTFAHIFNHYFGDGTVILVKADPEGRDIGFSATSNWLELNHASKVGITKEMADEFLGHIENCQSAQCIEAKEIFNLIGPIFQKGFPTGISLLSVFAGKSRNTQTQLTKDGNIDDEINKLLPIFQLFSGENKDFWVWPDEVKEPAKKET